MSLFAARTTPLGLIPLLLLLLLAGPGAARAEAKKAPPSAAEEIDYVSMAAKLMNDGHFERAEKALEQADLKNPKLDLVRYWTLKGFLLLKNRKYAESVKALESAVAAGQQAPIVYVYLAQARFGAGDCRGALGDIDRSGETGRAMAGLHLLNARCWWELKDPGKAWAALDEGQKRFPGESEFLRQRVFYLIDLGLYQEAVERGQDYLLRMPKDSDDHLAIAEALRKGRRLTEAAHILEAARLRYPEDLRLTLLLAHAYLDQGRTKTAADLYGEAALRDSRYALEAAELNLKAGDYRRALHFNAQVLNQEKKMRQRVGVLVELERWEILAGLAPRLSRLGLLDDEEINYALAYAYFKSGDREAAEKRLKKLTRSDLFARASELRLAIETCSKEWWKCY